MVQMSRSVKKADLLSAIGALVLGMGLGAWIGDTLGNFVLPLILLGVACHALGMYAKHRVEMAEGVQLPGWYVVLYWLCWLLLAALLAVLLWWLI